MHGLDDTRNRRILVIDDNAAIHVDFRKILEGNASRDAMRQSRAALFGEETDNAHAAAFDVDSAFQGREGLEMVCKTLDEGQPYALAFVDIRMPPGWDGVETIQRLWNVDPDLLVVICTAFNDYNWSEMAEKIGRMDRWQILKKPFDNVEVRQLAASITEKWDLARKADQKLDEMQAIVDSTNRHLTAFRNAVDAGGIVAMTDVQGTILEVNDNFCDVSGYSRDELLGRNQCVVKSDVHTGSFFDEMGSTIGRGQTWRGEICNRAKDGSHFWVDATVVPMQDENDTVSGYLSLLTETTERHRLLEQLQKLAYFDSLTGLPNRDSILCSIQKTIDRKNGEHFALLFLDFDRFKLINDSLGHDVGDDLLREIANRLRETLRSTDTVIEPARLGGDEFVVLLDGLASPAAATMVADRLLQAFSTPYKLGAHTVCSTASIGVVTSEHPYSVASEMISDADLAMYAAKSAGKSRQVLFDQGLRKKAKTRLRIESELREAIQRDELTLAYQPIVSLDTGELQGFEALLRWCHPHRGLIATDEFVPVAEETGMIVPIGQWVLNEACQQLATWQQSLGDDVPLCMHVNISRKQLLLPDLVDVVRQTLDRHDIQPACLHLEVTESMIMYEQQMALKALNELRKLGVKIDIDDFGTGYSSLLCLQEFPLDMLKIDRSFVATFNGVRELTALLSAVITLSDNLGLQVIAEGIEDVDQLTLLQALGCGYGQGHFFSKPLDVDAVEAYIASQFPSRSSRAAQASTGIPYSYPTDTSVQVHVSGVKS